MNILVNLPEGFFTVAELTPVWDRLAAMGEIRRTSHNAAAEIQRDLTWADAVIMWSWPFLSEELLDAAPKLKFAGHIDIRPKAARIALDRGLAVSVSRHGFSPAVSELALSLMLSTLRKTSDYHMEMRKGAERWVRAFPTDINPLERQLTGSSVGIIGFGRVGQRLVQLLQPFQCDIRIYDPFVAEESIDTQGGSLVSLDELVAESDVVTLCAASNMGASHLLGPGEISKFRKNAIFVNVARAALVDTDALVARLKKGDLFAALDVFDKEPLESNSVLRTLANVYLTPHRAGGLMASVRRIVGWLVDDLESHIEGKERKHPLTEVMLPGLDA